MSFRSSSKQFPINGSERQVKLRQTRSSSTDYPHVVRPIPVWIADKAGTAKKTTAATSSITDRLPLSTDKAAEQHETTTDLSSDNKFSNDNTVDVKDTPVVTRTKSQSGLRDRSLSPTSPDSKTPNENTHSSIGAAIDSNNSTRGADTSNSANMTSRISSSTIQYPPRPQIHQPRITSGASRWANFVNITMNAANTGVTNEGTSKVVDIEALNAQTDLTGDWVGDNWEADSRHASFNKSGNWFRSIFFCFGSNRRSAKRDPIEQQYYIEAKRAQGGEMHRKQGDMFFARTRYFVSEQSREQWKPKLMKILLNNPYVPLTLRTINFITSVIALGLACSVFIESHKASPEVTQQASTIMAVCCQTTALVYLVYITYDEYDSKPLGLRDAKSKIRLIMLDLLFIIFSSANLSLAFNTLYDTLWLCHQTDNDLLHQSPLYLPYNHTICSRQRALASFIFLSLVSWVITFTISIFRLVERVSS
jgi:hypothetical protein